MATPPGLREKQESTGEQMPVSYSLPINIMDDIQASQQAVDFVINQANAQVGNCPGCNFPVASCHC